ncbi:MAG TPA: hypothetical protein VMX58_09525 [Patescibacteria group bacterium]|nr:hypothetical protein [Patescibacteria group bacterium]
MSDPKVNEEQKEKEKKFKIEKLEGREIPDDVALHSTDNQI